MKIAYYAYANTGRDTGVIKKIARSASVWQQRGNEIRLFLLSYEKRLAPSLSGFQITHQYIKKKSDLLFGPKTLFDLVKAWKPDLTYHRFSRYYPGMGVQGEKLKTVLEINTNDVRQSKVLDSPTTHLYHRLTREIVFKPSTGMCFLSAELANHFSKYMKPHIVIGDGIDLSNYSISPPPQNGQPRLLFMASTNSPWNGLDKLIALSKHFQDFQFDIVGFQRPLWMPEQKNVKYHGFLKRKEYMLVANKADIGICSLSPHLIGMNQNAPLRLREFLAYGLPCIVAHEDTDFPNGSPFLLKIPNAQDGVERSFAKIDNFVRKWRGSRVPRDKIKHLSANVKETRRLKFFETILSY